MSELLENPLAYLLPRKLILEGAIPKFGEVCELVVPIYEWKDIPKYCFVSHRWLYPDTPDNSFQTFSSVLRQYALQAPEIEYFWIDYACLPHEPDKRKKLTMQLSKILKHAECFIILPFALSSTSLIPTSNLQMYCFRAWCAAEFAAMIHRPSDITMTRLIRENSSLKVSFISLPSSNKKDSIVTLVNSFVVLKDIVLRDDFDSFCVFYSITSPNERAMVWDILHEMSDLISDSEPNLVDFLDQQSINEREGELSDKSNTLGRQSSDSETFEHHVYEVRIDNGKESVIHPSALNDACNCNCEAPECIVM